MSPRWSRIVALALLVPISALASGCYTTVTVRPDQISRLSGMASPQALAAGRESTIIIEDRTTIITADGTTAEVRGQPELTLTLRDGQVLSFEPPMQSTQLSPEELTIAGSNRPETRFRLEQIRGATATYQDLGMTMLAAVGLGVLLSFAIVGAIYLFVEM